jgi:hypothetical protein
LLLFTNGFWADRAGAWNLEAAYSYVLASNFEIEAGFTFISLPLPRDELRAYLPWLGVRPYASLSDEAELGFSFRGGGYFLTFYSAPADFPASEARTQVWTGWHFAVSPDVRVWLSPRVGLEFATEVAVGGAKDHEPMASDSVGASADMLFVGGSVGVVFAPSVGNRVAR